MVCPITRYAEWSPEALWKLSKSDDAHASDAASELVRRFTPICRITAFALCRSSYSTLDEAIEEGRVAVCQAISDYNPSEGAALTAVARRRIRFRMIDFLRREGLHTSRFIATDPLPATNDEIPTVFETVSTPENVSVSVDSSLISHDLRYAPLPLTDRQREVLILHFLEGIPQNQIAARLRISCKRVSELLTRAIGILKGYYGA